MTNNSQGSTDPLRLAVVDDYDVVVAGVARLLEPYPDRVKIVELDTRQTVTQPVDVALVDTFGQGEAHTPDLDGILNNPLARRAAIYTWRIDDALIDTARQRGFHGYLSKRLGAEELVAAIEYVHHNDEMVVDAGDDHARPADPPRNWPGRDHGLSEREAEVLTFITGGLTNTEIADMLYLSENSIKTYIRSLYRKIDVTRRTRAVLWGIDHGFRIEHHRLQNWTPTQ